MVAAFGNYQGLPSHHFGSFLDCSRNEPVPVSRKYFPRSVFYRRYISFRSRSNPSFSHPAERCYREGALDAVTGITMDR
jgi:hypothetical protein